MRRIIGGMFIVDCMLVALLSFSMTTPHRWGMKHYQYVSSQDLMDDIQIESSEEFLIGETSNHIMYATEIGNNADATGTIDNDVMMMMMIVIIMIMVRLIMSMMAMIIMDMVKMMMMI